MVLPVLLLLGELSYELSNDWTEYYRCLLITLKCWKESYRNTFQISIIYSDFYYEWNISINLIRSCMYSKVLTNKVDQDTPVWNCCMLWFSQSGKAERLELIRIVEWIKGSCLINTFLNIHWHWFLMILSYVWNKYCCPITNKRIFWIYGLYTCWLPPISRGFLLLCSLKTMSWIS